MDVKLEVLGSDFKTISSIDEYESLLWTARVREYGTFEIYTRVTETLLDKLSVGRYLICDKFYDRAADTASLMIIEDWQIKSDAESGDKLIITGRDLKSLLTRRIIWKQTAISKDTRVENAIITLVNDAIVNPEIQNRKIVNFIFDTPSGDWGTIKEDIQYSGDNLYDAIYDICDKYNINYDIIYDFTDNKFHMKLIHPVDHGWDQTDVTPIIFSPTYQNLKNSNYKEVSSEYKNVALVHGEGDEYNMIKTDVNSDVYSGIERRELFVNASDLSQELEDGTIYGTTTYTNMLKQRGETELKKVDFKKTYEGEAETNVGYEYGIDYQIGDVVEILNEYGIESKVVVKEMVLSDSTSGKTLVPTFEALKDEEGE